MAFSLSSSAPRTPTDGDYTLLSSEDCGLSFRGRGKDSNDICELQYVSSTDTASPQRQSRRACLSEEFAEDDFVDYSSCSLSSVSLEDEYVDYSSCSLSSVSITELGLDDTDSALTPSFSSISDDVSYTHHTAAMLKDLDTFGLPATGIMVDDLVVKNNPAMLSYTDSLSFGVPTSAFNGGTAMSNVFKSFFAPGVTTSPTFEDDLPPIDTPALEPDNDVDVMSQQTSPLWGGITPADVSYDNWALFSNEGRAMHIPAPSMSSGIDVAASLSTLPSHTVSPRELHLPLATPFDNAKVQGDVQVPQSALFNNKRTFAESEDVSTVEVGRNKRSRLSPVPASEGQSSAPRFTGTRKTAIPLLDENAPLQKRVYKGPPSKTSKRAVPAAAARKVAALQAVAEEKGIDTSEAIEDTIQKRRLHNTLAARRSRHRKAEHLEELESTIAQLREALANAENEKDVWIARAMAAGWTERPVA